jgi:hypothetical protein
MSLEQTRSRDHTIPVTKAARHENSSRSCRMRAIGNLLYAAPSNRSEQYRRQGDETGEEQQVVQGTDGHRSPALCSIMPVGHPKTLAKT